MENHITEKKRRPGRKIAAEKRRIARSTLIAFARSDDYAALPRKVQVAIEALCPDIHESATFSFPTYASVGKEEPCHV